MYTDLLENRNIQVDGVGNWTWVARDTGAWQGPHEEWPFFKERYIKHRKGNKLAVQAGGNLGLYPRLLSDIFETVYTFEPDPLNFHCLVNNCQKDSIVKFNCALGDTHGMVQLSKLSDDNLGMHRIHNKAVRGATPVLRIDDFDFDACDLIQLDVEGYEYNILLGAVNTIAKFKPLISVELARSEITNLLSPFGYRIVDSYNADSFYYAD